MSDATPYCLASIIPSNNGNDGGYDDDNDYSDDDDYRDDDL